eukprot:Skav232365  [mRNA]  locus=scaffold1062:329040:329444:- [translate_table: standard]
MSAASPCSKFRPSQSPGLRRALEGTTAAWGRNEVLRCVGVMVNKSRHPKLLRCTITQPKTQPKSLFAAISAMTTDRSTMQGKQPPTAVLQACRPDGLIAWESVGSSQGMLLSRVHHCRHCAEASPSGRENVEDY